MDFPSRSRRFFGGRSDGKEAEDTKRSGLGFDTAYGVVWKLSILAILFLFVSCLSLYVLEVAYNVWQGIAGAPKAARQAAEDLGDALSPPVTEEKEEETETPTETEPAVSVPYSVAQEILHSGRSQRSSDGWEIMGTTETFEASGKAAPLRGSQALYEGPVINCSFLEGWTLEIHRNPVFASVVLEPTGIDADLVDSRGRFVMKLKENLVGRKSYLKTTKEEQEDYSGPYFEGDLLYLRSRTPLSNGPPLPYRFLVELQPPLDSSANAVVRECTFREFRPKSPGPGAVPFEEADWGHLPLQLPLSPGGTADIGFTVRIWLTRLPDPGEKTLSDIRPSASALLNSPVTVVFTTAEPDPTDRSLVYTIPSAKRFEEINSSQLRTRWGSSSYPEVMMTIKSEQYVRVDVAVLMHEGP